MNNIVLISVNWNQRPALELMLKSYVKYHYKGIPLRLMLFDNGSDDSSKQWLTENEIPFFNCDSNIGHENAVNIIYEELNSEYALLVDTDVEFKANVYAYAKELKGGIIAAGEMIDKNFINEIKIKNRLSPWFFMWKCRMAKEAGIKTFRDNNCNDWTYDVGSWFTEQLENHGFALRHIPRLEGNQDEDIVSMKYVRFDHIGKVSWDVFEKHQDRIDEVLRRRSYINQRVNAYDSISLKGKFVYG